MNTHNLAIVFGPTLFQTDGKDYKAGRVVEDLISHYVKIFNVGSAPPPLPWARPMCGHGEVEGGGSWICSVCRHLALEGRRGGVHVPANLGDPEPGGAGTAGHGSRFPPGTCAFCSET